MSEETMGAYFTRIEKNQKEAANDARIKELEGLLEECKTMQRGFCEVCGECDADGTQFDCPHKALIQKIQAALKEGK